MIAVIRFPGTNCDQDVFDWIEYKNHQAEFVWHLDQFDIQRFTALVLPGGFSYGDYLRSGALAARSPVMNSVKNFAAAGKPVLGICNGFQILCEAGLLPGALVQNEKRRFIDDWACLKLENKSWWSSNITTNSKINIPIAHGDGKYYISEEELKKITANNQIWLRYENNPNGSVADIAGVMNENKNVAGLMPHPERALFDWMGSKDGWGFL